MGISCFTKTIKTTSEGAESPANRLKLFWFGYRRASLIFQDKHSRTQDYTDQVAAYYDKAMKGRTQKARLGVLNKAISWAEYKDQKERYYKFFDDILELSISLKKTHPKTAASALEKLLTDSFVRATWEWNPLAGVGKEKIQRAENTLAEVYENIGDACSFSRNMSKWYAKADEITSSGAERRAEKLEAHKRVYY